MNRQVLRLAIPNIISNLSIPMLSSVDTALMGRMDEPYYIGAIAVGGVIFNFLYWGFGFLRMGSTGLTAGAFGRNDRLQIALVLYRALLVAAIAGVLLILLQRPISEIAFRLIDSGEQVRYHAGIYFSIRIWSAPATLALYSIQGWMLGLQNARDPMVITVIHNLLNIIFNIALVYGLGMHADGVALGTVIADYTALALAFTMVYKRYGYRLIRVDFARVLQREEVLLFFRVSSDIMIRTLSVIFAFAFFTAQSAASGDQILAANTILIQLWNILAYGVDGFAYAAESLVGRYTGAADLEKLKKSVAVIMGWGLGLGAGFSGVYALGNEYILRLYTDQPEIIDLAMQYYIWTIAAPLINAYCFIWDGVFIGATATKQMRNSMLFSLLVVYLPVYYLGFPVWGNHALWLAMALFMVFRGVTLSLYARSAIIEPIKQKHEQ